jgi:hypothetical protein
MSRVTIFVVALLTIGPSLVAAQTLAEVARAEEARRKTVPKATKVYTNDDLKTDFTAPTPPAADAAAVPAPPPAGTPSAATSGNATPDASASAPHDQAWWSARMNAARSLLDRTKMFGDALQSRIAALNTDFVNRDDPAQRSVIEQDRNKAVAELDRVKKDIEDQTKAITDIEDEARRAGVPAGWLR